MGFRPSCDAQISFSGPLGGLYEVALRVREQKCKAEKMEEAYKMEDLCRH